MSSVQQGTAGAGQVTCRACGDSAGDLVLDLGLQPACDYFPRLGDAGPDPAYPLQMWLCRCCGLAQLAADPTVPEEPRGAEPAALVTQAADAVGRCASAGLLRPGAAVAEYGSPHGGSWLGLLAGRGLVPVADDEPADLVVDCFGLMHAADQAGALAGRARRLAPGGVLLLQFHSLETIIRLGQWNALRHGHFGYYSVTALSLMLAAAGLAPAAAWQFELYGGTVLLAARRTADLTGPPDESVRALLAADAAAGVRDPAALGRLGHDLQVQTGRLSEWLATERAAGRTVLGYGAASRAVALLRLAGADRSVLPAVVDASPAKAGLRMPGTDIPVVGPAELSTRRPDSVLLFLPDLRAEVRAAYPEVEAAGGRWVAAELHLPASARG